MNNLTDALLEACRNGDLEEAQRLVEAGHRSSQLPPLAPAMNLNRSLHEACCTGHLEVVKWLVEAGADVNAADGYGWTAVMVASRSGHLEVVKWLLEAGADVNATVRGGWTPLMRASLCGHLEVVKWLLEAGADVNAADGDGWTPLILASINGHLEVVDLLQAKGADTAATNNDGRTALDLARKGHGKVVHLLESKPTPNPFLPTLTASTAIVPRRRRAHAAIMTFLMCGVEQLAHVPARLVAEFLYTTREDDVWDAD
jgi:ankyrin repeat protein